MKARIDDFEKFIEENSSSRVVSHLTVYHPVIPFKHHEKIIKHVAKTDRKGYGEGKYCLASDNCEHLAWGVGLGIFFSQQANNRSSTASFFCPQGVHDGCVANGGKK